MAIVLPTPTADFLDRIKTALSVGPNTSFPDDSANNINAAAQSYLRAQDFATALELLQEALGQPSELTATEGSTTTLEDTTAFVADSQIGNLVTFASDTTTVALRGLSFRVQSHTVTVLTFDETLPGAVVTGDTYTVKADFLTEVIAELREGKVKASASVDIYGDARLVLAKGIQVTMDRMGVTLVERNIGVGTLQVTAGATTSVIPINGGPYRIDEFKNRKATISGAGRIILSNDENSITVRGVYGSAPVATTAVTITVPDINPERYLMVHAGRGNGENVRLANLIDQVQTAVEASTIPT